MVYSGSLCEQGYAALLNGGYFRLTEPIMDS